MDALGWTLLGINLAGYAFAFRRIAGQLAWHFNANPGMSWNRNKEFPTMEQWLGAFLMAAALSCVWPLSIPAAYGLASARTQRGVLRNLFYAPPKVRERIMQDRINELERQVMSEGR